jgi:WD40 repeat protein
MHKYTIMFFLFIPFILGACSSQSEGNNSGIVEKANTPFPVLPYLTITVLATQTLQLTPTITPTPIPTGTAPSTETPTLALPMSVNTPYLQPNVGISAENVFQIREIARYGEPVTYSVMLTNDGKRVIVHDSQGIWISDREKQEIIGFVDVIPRPNRYYQGNVQVNSGGTCIAVLTTEDIRIINDQNELITVFPYPGNAFRDSSTILLSHDLTLAAFTDDTDRFNPTVKVWDVHGNKMVFEIEGWLDRFLNDGIHLAINRGSGITLLDINTWDIAQEILPDGLRYAGPIYGSSTDGRFLLFAAYDQIAIWDIYDQMLESILDEKWSRADLQGIKAVSFSQTNQFVFLTTNNVMKVFKVAGGSKVSQQKIDSNLFEGALILGDDGNVTIDAFVERITKSWSDSIVSLSFNPHSSALLYTGVQQFVDGLNWWSTSFTACSYGFWETTTCDEGQHNLFFDDQGKLFSFIKLNNGIYQVHEGSNEKDNLFTQLRIADWIVWPSPYLLKDRRFLIFTTTNGHPGSETVILWDLIDGRLLKRWWGTIDKIVISSNSRYVAIVLNKPANITSAGSVISGFNFLVYDLETNGIIYEEMGNENRPFDMSFAGNNTKLIYFFQHHSDDDSDYGIVQFRELDLDAREPLDVFKLSYRRPWYPTALALSPRENMVGVGTLDGRILFINSYDGSEIYTVQAHRQGIGRLIFSPDGRWIASASREFKTGYEGFIRIWGIVP